MKGCAPLFLVIMTILHTQALKMGIDKGTLHCSRQKGSVTLKAEKGDYGTIVSSGFPGNYSTSGRTGLWCQVHIRLCSTCKIIVRLVELTFAECPVNTEETKANKDWCYDGCDHIHIHEVDPPYNKVTHKDYFSGDEGNSYASISGNVKIRHCVGNTFDSIGQRFQLEYEVVDKSELHQGVVSQYGENIGVVRSPNFPHGYALNGETFTFMIQNLDPYGHVRLLFDDWDIAPETKVKVYDGFSESSPYITLERFQRPLLVSKTNTLVIVMSTGTRDGPCCLYSGFKAHYTLVSEEEWRERPRISCSASHPMQGGGSISFTGESSRDPTFYDCVWLIKRYTSHNTADAVILRLREVLLGDGWLRYEKRNSLEVRHGVTSEAPLIARYTSNNLTDIALSYTAQTGLYLRLRGGFYSTDKLSFMFTAVKNITGRAGCPGYFDYMCHGLFCIDQELMCDGVDHCGDGSDESPLLNCSMSELWRHSFKWSMPYVEEGSTAPSRPSCDGISCGRRCITLAQVCDGVVDCEDSLDETGCAKTIPSKQKKYKNSARTSTEPSMLVVAMVTILCAFHGYSQMSTHLLR